MISQSFFRNIVPITVDVADQLPATIGSQGKGQYTTVTERIACTIIIGNNAIDLDRVYSSPQSSTFILDENALWRQHRIVVDTENQELVWTSTGARETLYLRGKDTRFWARVFLVVQDASVDELEGETTLGQDDLTIAQADLVATAANDNDHCILEPQASKAFVNTTNAKLIWAARLNVSADGLRSISKAIIASDLTRPNDEERRLIDADIPRLQSINRRVPASKTSTRVLNAAARVPPSPFATWL